MHVLPGSHPAVFVEGNFLVANEAHNIFLLFFGSTSQRWGKALHEVVVLIVRIQRPHPSCWSIAYFSLEPYHLVLLNLHGRFSWPLPSFFCSNYLRRMTTPLPHRFSPRFTHQQLFLHARIVVDVYTALLLLLSLCLQLAAKISLHCLKWRADVWGHAICGYFNKKVLLPKPLGTTKASFLKQQVGMGVQRVRVA